MVSVVQVGFYVWTIVALVLVFQVLKRARPVKVHALVAGGMAAWLAYVGFLSFSGFLSDFSLPPRIPLFVVLPAILAILVLTGRRGFRGCLEQTPTSMPVYFQSFRVVVELLIYGAFLEGVFPERVTFEGINFDVLVGLSAPVIALLHEKGKLHLTVLRAWNLAALGILAVTVYAFISSYYFPGARSTASPEFVNIPYVFLAAVLLPAAVFFHVISLRQIALLRKRARAAEPPTIAGS